MAWPPPPTIPEDEIVARWWRAERDSQVAADAQPETPPVIDRPEWRAAALAARVRRTIRDLDVALAPACDCAVEGYKSGCRWCRPDVDRRHTRPEPGHGDDVMSYRGLPIEYSRHEGRVLSVR